MKIFLAQKGNATQEAITEIKLEQDETHKTDVRGGEQ